MAHLLPGHTQNGAIQINVLAPGQIRVEARANFQQAGNAATHAHAAAGRRGHAAENLEQGAFAGPIAADDSERFPLLDGEADVLERPDGLTIPVAMVFFPDPQQWIGLAAHFGPPDIQVAAQRAGADLAQAVGFREGFDGNDCRAHRG